MDDNRDKDMMRNQLIAIVLMTVLFVVWFKWFMPPPQPKKSPTPVQQQQAAEKPAQPKAEGEPGKAPLAPSKGTWPNLPPEPTIEDPAAEEVTMSDGEMELVFTKIGARLKRATLILGEKGAASVQLIPTEDTADTQAVYPLSMQFTDESLGDAVNSRRFDVEKDPSGKALTFSLTIPGKGVVRKRFSFGERARVLEAAIDYENDTDQPEVLGMDQTPAYYFYWGPNVHSDDQNVSLKQSFTWFEGGKLTELPTSKMTPPQGEEIFSKTVLNPEWVAVRSAYFVVALKPGFDGAQGWTSGGPKRFRFGLAVPRFEVAAKGSQTNTFSLYLGPCEQRTLAAAWPTLPQVLRFFQSPPWGFMDWFAKLLLKILNWFHGYIPNYGLAIIFLTIVVRFGMYPLTLKSMKSMKKMQLLGPEMEELKKKYGEDQQELNKKMMELYKERGVNPVGGCLPMLLQMPIFIALYRMLWNAYELRGAPFFWWITDLSQPDRMFHIPALAGQPFVSMFQNINLLPLLMGLSMVLSQKVMPVSGPSQNPQQKMMMNIMPIFFAFMCYNMASGLNLYILTSTLLGVVQQKFIHVSDSELTAKKVIGKRQHFYTAAQARKRQMAREAKKEKKK